MGKAAPGMPRDWGLAPILYCLWPVARAAFWVKRHQIGMRAVSCLRPAAGLMTVFFRWLQKFFSAKCFKCARAAAY